jgi:hypothetical protein
MLERILETLSSYNARQKRESDERTHQRALKRAEDVRLSAISHPTGIVCPACHCGELGDTGTSTHGGWMNGNYDKDAHSIYRVLCPKCGYEGERHVYQSYETPQARSVAVDPVDGRGQEGPTRDPQSSSVDHVPPPPCSETT